MDANIEKIDDGQEEMKAIIMADLEEMEVAA
jgi:hypothetical protein